MKRVKCVKNVSGSLPCVMQLMKFSRTCADPHIPDLHARDTLKKH